MKLLHKRNHFSDSIKDTGVWGSPFNAWSEWEGAKKLFNVSQTSLRPRYEFWERVRKELTSKENRKSSWPQKKLPYFYYSQENSILTPDLATTPPSTERITRYIRFIICQGQTCSSCKATDWVETAHAGWWIPKRQRKSNIPDNTAQMFDFACYLFIYLLLVCLFSQDRLSCLPLALNSLYSCG